MRAPPFSFTAAELAHLNAVALSLRTRGLRGVGAGSAADLAVRLIGVVAAEHGPDIARAILRGCLDAVDRWTDDDEVPRA